MTSVTIFPISTMFGSYLPPVQLFVGVLLPLFLLVCANWCPTHIVLCISSSCLPYVASFSGLSIFECLFDIL